MEKAKLVKNIKLGVAAVIAILFIVVVAKNFTDVKVDFLLISINMPLALLLFVTLVLGAIVGFVGGGFYIRHRLAGKLKGK